MKAAILKDTQILTIKNLPTPHLKEGEILVKVAYAGICRTDRKAYHMSQQDLHMPRILGHEITGTIAAVDPAVKNYHKGDNVQIHPGIGCGICENCQDGNDQVCAAMQILGFHIDGGFAEYCVIPKDGVLRGIVQKIPPTLPLKIAVLTEPLACVVNAFERICPQKGQRLFLCGGGALGLLTATLAKINGITSVCLTEKDPRKQKICKDLGFPCYHSEVEESTIIEALGGKPDIAIACCPDNDAFTLCLKLLKKRGIFSFFSGLTADHPIDKNTLNLIHYKELAIFGSYGCGLNHGKKALNILDKHQELFSFPTAVISIENLEKTLKELEVTDTIFKLLAF